jgi:hypothetical protein
MGMPGGTEFARLYRFSGANATMFRLIDDRKPQLRESARPGRHGVSAPNTVTDEVDSDPESGSDPSATGGTSRAEWPASRLYGWKGRSYRHRPPPEDLFFGHQQAGLAGADREDGRLDKLEAGR